MADWSGPVLSDTYASVLTKLGDKDIDALTMQVAAATNVPTGAFKYVRASDKFQEWNGSSYVDKVLGIAGGGTGGATASAARTSLGLGTMATQNSSAVSISGGTLAGSGSGITALNGSNISSGTVAAARLGSGTPSASNYLRGDGSWQALVLDLPYDAATKTVGFTAVVNTFYNCNGTFTVALPTVVGNGGKIIGLINIHATGFPTLDPNGTETILGALTYAFNWGQYSAIILKADANNGKWDII